jgi:hypothetical protein
MSAAGVRAKCVVCVAVRSAGGVVVESPWFSLCAVLWVRACGHDGLLAGGCPSDVGESMGCAIYEG